MSALRGLMDYLETWRLGDLETWVPGGGGLGLDY